MSTHGSRKRQLLDLEVFIERSFADSDYDPPVSKQVNEPRLSIRLGRFELDIEWRPHRWMWAKNSSNFYQFGTPWFYGEWFVEDKYESDPPGPVYLRSGDWTEYHDGLIR